MSALCGADNNSTEIHSRTFKGRIQGDGSFVIDERFETDTTDSSETRSRVRIRGTAQDGVVGTIEVDERYIDGQARAHLGDTEGTTCATEPISFEAREPATVADVVAEPDLGRVDLLVRGA
jgi:hypothetical protein